MRATAVCSSPSALCSGCGVCVAVCPRRALRMTLAANGDPRVERTGDCSERCGRCRSVCPFTDGVHRPREMTTACFGRQSAAASDGLGFDEAVGWHRRVRAGYSCAPGERSRGASGGMVTWTLGALLARGLITRAAVVRLAAAPSRGKLFEYVGVSTTEEIRQAAGSVYHPVEASDLLRRILGDPSQRWAIVAVPCLCTALRKVEGLREAVPFVLGLACGMYQNTYYTELLAARSGIKLSDLRAVRYRLKPAGNYGFQAADSARTGPILPYRGLPYFLGKHGYFRLAACDFCADVFAEAADACFMDAWLPEYTEEPEGTSLVVVRDQQLDEVLRAGAAAGQIWAAPSAPAEAAKSQQGQIRRKQHLLGMRMGVGRQGAGAGLADRVTWMLSRVTQRRSKLVWRLAGARAGLLLFWMAMLDLVALQWLLDVAAPVLCRPAGAARRLLSSLRRAAT